jgi:hypothetical protein
MAPGQSSTKEAKVRARVVERGTGAVVGEIEAGTSYGLWLALLAWGEQKGVDRFQVPSRFRTERATDELQVATPASEGPTSDSPPLAPLVRGEQVDEPLPDSPLTRGARGVDPAPSHPLQSAPGGAAVQLPLTDDLEVPAGSPAEPHGNGARAIRRRRANGAAEQLRLFD